MVKALPYTIIWDKEALKHFKQILIYLDTQSEQAPKIVKEAVVTRLELVKANPLICEVDKLKNPADATFRAFVVFNYRLTYQIKTDQQEIRILRIRHTSREPLGY